MSEEAFRTRVSGKLTLLSSNGANVVVDDGSGKALAGLAAGKDPKAALHQEELEKAKKAGYKQGWDECQRKMAADVANLNAQLDEARKLLPEALNAYFVDLETQMKSEIVELGFKVAAAIAGYEMTRNDITTASINAALSPLLTASGVKIHVSPAFLAKGVVQAPAGASFVADPKLKLGEIMVDSQQGLVDGTLKGRLETLKEELLKNFAKEPSDA